MVLKNLKEGLEKNSKEAKTLEKKWEKWIIHAFLDFWIVPT
jgi:hypothetical protein